MKRLIDSVRALLISPEMLCLLVPIGLWVYWPAPAEIVTTQIIGDLKWGFGAALVPAGFLAACYHFGTEVLSPRGSRKVLLEWPNYGMLKSRVILALMFCAVAVLVGLIGVYLIAKTKSSFGATLILAGWLSSVAALATVALARWKIREIFGE
jgi:hypothetical protein